MLGKTCMVAPIGGNNRNARSNSTSKHSGFIRRQRAVAPANGCFRRQKGEGIGGSERCGGNDGRHLGFLHCALFFFLEVETRSCCCGSTHAMLPPEEGVGVSCFRGSNPWAALPRFLLRRVKSIGLFCSTKGFVKGGSFQGSR